MKRLVICLAILTPLLLPAEEKKDAAKPPAKQGRLTLPEDAVRIEPNTYRYKDSDGTVWIYRQTPFGLTRYEETEAHAQSGPRTAPPGLKAFDAGEKVRFEKMTPFGKHVWTRKKTELTEDERLAWEKTQAQPKSGKETSARKDAQE